MPDLISLAELKAYLRIEHDEEDRFLESLLRSAEATAEIVCKRKFDDPPPEPVRLAVCLFAGHFNLYRDGGDERGYNAMMTAFKALLSPYVDEAKMF